MQPTPLLQEAPLEPINRIAYGFSKGGEYFTSLLLHSGLTLASIIPWDLESLPLPLCL
jgi:hypothetical protein